MAVVEEEEEVVVVVAEEAQVRCGWWFAFGRFCREVGFTPNVPICLSFFPSF